ncbi:MED6 mediator sub complex component-domain-containing protein [Echria macrotheca]|uniref:Mediator of RNA polymerase II transcription subunit 6 n=1 Tax=Echria macrotheca TaxID=438768 RepID=A0AAJ0BPS4_9PEZI|nr:MED6 mediator sub complex component-domain-containing protein [Echria macrotheca]
MEVDEEYRVPEAIDEVQWRMPPNFEGGIHSNSVLYYFAESPFFDQTSNNAVVFKQGLNNPNMVQFLATRELFEGRLRSMSGLEFMVAQEPAETGPGAGTGVWVINKQTRRKRQGEEDEIIVHATYFIVGEHVYMAPSFADVISQQMGSIGLAIEKIPAAVDSVQTWSPAKGRTYRTPPKPQHTQRDLDGRSTPLPDTSSQQQQARTTTADSDRDARLMFESFLIHERYGGEYIDQNPITGKPGEFHLSSTGRKDKLAVPKTNAPPLKPEALPALNTKVADSPLAKGGKETKSPKTPNVPKPKRRKSKIGPAAS